MFFQTVCDFENIDDKTNRCKDISKAVQKSILNHQWYNVPEMIPLSLFDKGYSFHEKDNLAKKILTFPKKEEFASRDGYHWGKPIFQSKMPSNAVEAAYSADVWKIFQILGISDDFLKFPSNTWEDIQSYVDGLHIAKNLKVCNDSAERSLKMIQDYISQTNKEDKLQDILQVVEENRSIHPNLRKRFEK